MKIGFKNRKLANTFNDDILLARHYGKNSKYIMRRMSVLRAAVNLSQVSSKKPERCHELKGDRKGEYAVDLKQPYRLVFTPDHKPVPRLDNGNFDLKSVTAIIILGVEDYH